jgi:hypothetical protein
MISKRIILVLLAITAWQSAAAQSVYFGQNKVQYRDFDWYYIQTSNFDIYFYEGEDTLPYSPPGRSKKHTKKSKRN